MIFIYSIIGGIKNSSSPLNKFNFNTILFNNLKILLISEFIKNISQSYNKRNKKQFIKMFLMITRIKRDICIKSISEEILYIDSEIKKMKSDF